MLPFSNCFKRTDVRFIAMRKLKRFSLRKINGNEEVIQMKIKKTSIMLAFLIFLVTGRKNKRLNGLFGNHGLIHIVIIVCFRVPIQVGSDLPAKW